MAAPPSLLHALIAAVPQEALRDLVFTLVSAAPPAPAAPRRAPVAAAKRVGRPPKAANEKRRYLREWRARRAAARASALAIAEAANSAAPGTAPADAEGRPWAEAAAQIAKEKRQASNRRSNAVRKAKRAAARQESPPAG